MKSFLLGTAATIALCATAVAADPGQSGMNRPSVSEPMQTQSQPADQAAQRINPSDLSRKQISLIQRELNDQGFDTGSVDGIWGPETQQAIHSFQKLRNLTTNQPLNQETLSALGVNLAGTPNEGTTGSGMGNKDEPASAPAPENSK